MRHISDTIKAFVTITENEVRRIHDQGVGLSKMLDGERAKELTGRKEIERTHGDAVGSTLVCG